MHPRHELLEKNVSQKILIIEDSIEDFEFTTRALTQAGFQGEWHHVQDGQQALDYLDYLDQQNKTNGICDYPSLILLDLNIPRVSGVEILDNLKQHALFKKIPVLILSTSNHKSHVDECYSKGANSYIHKSLNYKDLKKSMESVIDYWFANIILPDPASDNSAESEQQSFYIERDLY